MRRWLGGDVNRMFLWGALVVVAFDLLLPMTYAADLNAYNSAPNNGSLNPADDITSFGTDLLTSLIALLRDGAIVFAAIGLALQLTHMRQRNRRRTRGVGFVVAVGVTAMVALEAFRVIDAGDYSSGHDLLVTSAVCLLNAVVTLVFIEVCSRSSRSDHPQQVTQLI